MKKISREIAKIQLAINRITNATKEELIDILCSDYIYNTGEQEGENIAYNTIYDVAVSQFLVTHFKDYILKGVSNNYLKKIMEAQLEEEVMIIGNPDEVYPCNCCGYLTLENKADYDICQLCGWEDDGTVEMGRYSPVNRGSLKEYGESFLKNMVPENIIYDKSPSVRSIPQDTANEG